MSTDTNRSFNPSDYELSDINPAPGFAKAAGIDNFEYLAWPMFPSPWIVTLVDYQGWLGVLVDDFDGKFAEVAHEMIRNQRLRSGKDYLRLSAKVAKAISRMCHPQSGLHDHEAMNLRMLLTIQGRMRVLRVCDLTYMKAPVGEALLARNTPPKGDA